MSINAQRDEVEIKSTCITNNTYMLESINGFGGGNMAVLIGDDGVLLVDAMYNWMVPKIDSTISTLTKEPVKLVVNTHFHTDHIAGNITYRNKAEIIGHKNIANHLVQYPDSIKNLLLPTKYISKDSSFSFNNEKIILRHFQNSHTDGDLIIHFKNTQVLHLGDLFFNGMFPGIYTKGGGNLEQLIQTIQTIIKEYPDNTTVIPGHGPIGSMSDLKYYHTMLVESSAIIKQGLAANKNVEDLIKENVLAKYDKLGSGGAQTTSQYINMLYNLLK